LICGGFDYASHQAPNLIIMKTLKLNCNHCLASEDYTAKDLEISGGQDDIEASISCKRCGDLDVGSSSEILELIEDLPEPDPDTEYDRLVEDKLIEEEIKK